MTSDCVVIGAGYAGLSAAEMLINEGWSVRVVEARERVGGRTHSLVNGLGERVDIGGQFVSDEMPYVLNMIDRFGGCLIEPEITSGAAVGLPFPDDGSHFSEASRLYYHQLPTTAQLSAEVGGLSLAGWLARTIADEGVRSAARSMAECANCIDAEILPLKELLRMRDAGPDGFTEMQYFVDGSLHRIAELLAEKLGCVDFGRPVRSVTRQGDRFRVEAGDDVYEARTVLVATSPLQAREMAFEPALPVDLMRALQAFHPTDTFKFLIRYDRAFWRERGLSGLCQWSEPSGMWFGDSSFSAEKPMLVGFAGGPGAAALRLLSARDRRAKILEDLAKALGAEAAAPLDYVERDWAADPLGTGGYNAFAAGPHAEGAVERIRRGENGLAFACTELATRFPGFVEGAIRTGRDMAAHLMETSAGRRRSA
ncbi:flavin monoamine oxidase family protein [Roseibium sediminicola]|uniref:FAD-dependent oxidoreductase n=1 Tax=Roseibium sediminicola TaxID=2933272 RepID=A0ABT0GW35_9HYPH|nr:FAD-dependent oxidoreductase [Roseibium sp. CAU 1639]MCK7613656.1 FAD-dependent oxidoreductase [Roseibium sp. CAU 1639]